MVIIAWYGTFPQRDFRMNPVRTLVHFAKINMESRTLITDLIRRDFRVRYLGSAMGSYWNFIHPLAMIAIYTVIFSYIMKVRLGDEQTSPLHFTIYLCAGLLPWTAFQETVLRSSAQFHEHANFIKKIAFPKEIIQSITTGSTTLTFMISMSFYLLLLLCTGHIPGLSAICLPFLILAQLLFASGMGMILGVFNVFLRDVQQVLNILFQVWFWMTPVVYSIDRIPPFYQKFFLLNPFYYFSRTYQDILVWQKWPDFRILGICLILGLVSYTVGAATLLLFRDQIADEL
ncbi:MAG: ABC transporter permease [Deltaproteobacteria bacterium]|nr:ABC transporter permease [Deltaproteobacteria bacterium]